MNSCSRPFSHHPYPPTAEPQLRRILTSTCHTCSKAATCSSPADQRKGPDKPHYHTQNFRRARTNQTHLHSGLGEQLSVAFAKEGCTVAINYYNRIEPAQQVQKQCEEQGVKAVIIKAVCLSHCCSFLVGDEREGCSYVF